MRAFNGAESLDMAKMNVNKTISYSDLSSLSKNLYRDSYLDEVGKQLTVS